MAEVRYVTVPRDIEVSILNQQTGKPVSGKRSFEDFVKDRTNDPTHFGKTLDDLMLGYAVRTAFFNCKPGDVIGLTLEQWEGFCKALREPSTGYNPEVMFQLLPMVLAILDAPATKPASIDLDADQPEKPSN